MTARKAPAPGSYEAFLAEAFGGGTETIRGVEVRIPTDVPLAMEQRLNDLRESESEDDLHELVALLFGDDVFGRWIENGMGAMEFKTVLAWGMAHSAGAGVSFMEAFEMVRAEEAGEGKAPSRPNRQARRAASKSRSTSTGGRSARTSAASTASRRKSSRA
ncbi:hypothetical protein ACFYO0_14625 [Streptomyces sp. NPDC006365]|uniref:hypothetical protein n=1 Tax=Streptomyces sp. NPDC006365 TaxID=3364744 RepID=UPI0036BA66DB